MLFHQTAPTVLTPPRPVGRLRAAHTGQQTRHVFLHHACALTAPHAKINLGGKKKTWGILGLDHIQKEAFDVK